MTRSFFPFTRQTIEPPDPASFNASTWAVNGTAYAYINTRKTVLEPSVAGVDKAMSWSLWLRVNNIAVGAQRIFGNTLNTAGDQQYGMFLQSQTTATNNQMAQFSIFTNTTNFITIRASERLLKNRFEHWVFTYSGSETASGLNIYRNGVLDSSASKVLTGTFTGALNNANLRFQISSFFSSTQRLKGNMRNFCVWDKELTQSDVDELFGGGSIVNPTTVSFYAAEIVAHYPLFSTLDCLNDATLNFTNNAGNGYASVPMSPTIEKLSILNSNPSNTNYVAFGMMLRTGESEFTIFTRSGTGHVTLGNWIKKVFDASNLKAAQPVSTAVTIIDDATYDLRGGAVGIVDGNVMIMTAKYNSGTLAFVDAGRYESTDGTVGETFGAYVQMGTLPSAGYSINFHGRVIPAYTQGEYIVGYHEYTVAAQEIFVWRRIAGVWTKQSVCVGGAGDGYNEPAIIRKGNIYIMLIRAQASARLEVTFGTEAAGVITWTAPANTGLSVGVAMADMAWAPDGTLTVIFADRGDGFLKISRGNRLSSIIADPTDWNAASSVWETIDGTANILGYPSVLYDDWKVAICVSSEFSSSRADLFVGFGLLGA